MKFDLLASVGFARVPTISFAVCAPSMFMQLNLTTQLEKRVQTRTGYPTNIPIAATTAIQNVSSKNYKTEQTI